MQVEDYIDDIIEISDSVRGASDNAAVQAAKLAADNRKWIASKLLPKQYGERTEVTGKDGAPLIPPTAAPDRLAAILVAMAQELPRSRAPIASRGDDGTDNETR